MKYQKQKRRSSDRNTDKVVTFVCLAALFIIFLVAKASGSTYFKFTYPSTDGVTGRFIITDESSGDSITGGVLTETERAALTYWKGSANLDPGSYTVEGFVFEASDTSFASYRVDVYPQAINDTVLLLQDSLEALESWVAQQTEVTNLDGWNPITDNDSLIVDMSSLSERPTIGDTIQREAATATELAKAIDSINALLDTLQLYDGRYALATELVKATDSVNAILDTLQLQDDWGAQQTEVANLDGWNPTSDSVNVDVSAAMVSDNLIDRIWRDDILADTNLSGEFDSTYWAEYYIWAALDSLSKIIDSLEAQDGWAAHQTTVDSLWDSLLTLQDTVEAALSDAAMGDKIWVDASSRTLSAYRWSVAERDSVLAALTDAAIGDKVWTDATTRSVTESVTVDVSDAMTTGGLISKIEDSVHANVADYKATGYSTHNAADIWTSGTRTLTAFGFSVALSSGQPTNIAESTWAKFIDGSNEDQFKATGFATHSATDIWNIAFGTGFTAGSMGDSINNSSYVQGSASGLTAAEVADSVWNLDTSDVSTSGKFGQMLKDTSAYQGSASGLTAAEVADSVWNLDTSQVSTSGSYGVILKDTSAYQGGASGLTAAEVADSVWNEDTTGHYVVGTYGYEATGSGAGGSDTTAIKSMMLGNLFSRVATDTPIVLWNDGKVKLSDTDYAAIEDSVHANAADYKASGYSSHNAADVWAATGGDSVLNAIEDVNKANFKADVSGLSSHSVLDVYNQFIAGTNEQQFWISKSSVADTTWQKFNDGSNEDNFKADVSLLALQAEVVNLDGWNPLTDNDSLIVDMSSLSARPVIGDTIQRNASVFVPANDSVIVDVSSAITAGGLTSNIEDSVHANAADYKATGFSTHGAADVWTVTGGDSVLNAIEDANKDNFKADTSRVIAIVDTILDSLQAQDDWIAHQTTSDSLYDSLLIILDSLEQLESWVAKQVEVENLNGWNPITISESLVVAMAPLANRPTIGDTIQCNASILTTSDNIGVNLDDVTGTLDSAELGLTAVAKTWGYDTSSISAGVGQMLKDTGAYQGSASGLTVDQIVDGVWNEDTAGHNASQSFGLMLKDTLVYQGGATSAWNSTQRDSVLAALSDGAMDDKVWTDPSTRTITDKTGFSLTAEERGHIEDSIYAHAADYHADVAALIDTCNAVIDSLQNWYDEIAAINNLVDSLYAVLDSIQNQDDWVGTAANQVLLLDSLYAVLDSLQNQDNWVASHSAADVWTNATRTLSATGIDAFWDEDTTGHGTASSFSVMLKDTGAYQGAAAGITASAISDSVWGKAQSAYTTSGTFGYNLDTTISSVDASGSGAYTFNIVLIDSGAVTDSVIPGAIVYVNNYAQSAKPYWDITDNNGIATVQIDAGNWVRFTTEPGFAANLDSFTNSESATETLYVYCDAGSRTTVAFELMKPNGDPYSLAKININLSSVNDSILKIGDTIVVSPDNYTIFATANNEGLASINLTPNSDFTNDSTYYRCIIRDQHSRLIVGRFKCRVPDTSVVMRYQDLTRWE